MSTSTRGRRRTRKPAKSPEQRAAEAEQLHQQLTAQVEALTHSEAWMRFLTFTASFHSYSLNNLMLILAQCPEASLVAGYRSWQQRGRQVRSGERALKIFGYATKKLTEEDPATGEETETQRTWYPVLSVFDISQTDPIEGAEVLDHPAQRLVGTAPEGVWDTVTDWLTDRGWTIIREPIAGQTNGYTDFEARRIVVEASLSDAQAVKTLLHEAGHSLLHEDLDRSEYTAHRGIWETEAESVAYVAAGMAGLDTSAYSVGYVAGWADGDTDVLRTTASRVLGAVHTIAEALEDTQVDEAGDPDPEPEAHAS